jgi:hypothetical protein
MFRLLGLDVLPNHTPGLAYTAHRLILSGSTIYGEWYPMSWRIWLLIQVRNLGVRHSPSMKV